MWLSTTRAASPLLVDSGALRPAVEDNRYSRLFQEIHSVRPKHTWPRRSARLASTGAGAPLNFTRSGRIVLLRRVVRLRVIQFDRESSKEASSLMHRSGLIINLSGGGGGCILLNLSGATLATDRPRISRGRKIMGYKSVPMASGSGRRYARRLHSKHCWDMSISAAECACTSTYSMNNGKRDAGRTRSVGTCSDHHYPVT